MKTVDEIIRAVAELPDRNSPEGQPELMLVTGDELRAIIEAALNEQAARIAELEEDCDYCEKQWNIALATHENIAALKSRIVELERELGSWVKRADKTWHEKESAAHVAECDNGTPFTTVYAVKVVDVKSQAPEWKFPEAADEAQLKLDRAVDAEQLLKEQATWHQEDLL